MQANITSYRVYKPKENPQSGENDGKKKNPKCKDENYGMDEDGNCWPLTLAHVGDHHEPEFIGWIEVNPKPIKKGISFYIRKDKTASGAYDVAAGSWDVLFNTTPIFESNAAAKDSEEEYLKQIFDWEEVSFSIHQIKRGNETKNYLIEN